MPPAPSVPGAPVIEHLRSRAAMEIGRQAVRSSLFFAHFEQRARLTTPRHWLPEQVNDPAPRFASGVLTESKYQAFRHDLLIASFHPSHRPQWTAHELCHALVGFAYRPGATLLFHVLAAWLAELLPVALWYFFDEADLRRCARHHGGGPLFQTYCADCEREAERGPRPEDAASRRCQREGRRFVERELAAIAKSRRLGRPEGTRYATIDLAQDAVGYVAGHGARLRAPEMERFVALFFGRNQGHHPSLEALEARVLEVCTALGGAGSVKPWQASRWDYCAQDVGYRLLGVQCQTSGELAQALDTLIEPLSRTRSEVGVTECVRRYRALWSEAQTSRTKTARALPRPELLFALGYALPGDLGRAEDQMAEGVASACPASWEALGRRRGRVLRAFCAADAPERTPIGRRFARFLTAHEPGPVADLARLEAAITHVETRDAWADCLDPHEAKSTKLQLARGVDIVRIEHDVVGAPASEVRRAPRLDEARALIVLRKTGSEEVDVLELPHHAADKLRESQSGGLARSAFAMAETTLEDLLRAGVLVPTAYMD